MLFTVNVTVTQVYKLFRGFIAFQFQVEFLSPLKSLSKKNYLPEAGLEEIGVLTSSESHLSCPGSPYSYCGIFLPAESRFYHPNQLENN